MYALQCAVAVKKWNYVEYLKNNEISNIRHYAKCLYLALISQAFFILQRASERENRSNQALKIIIRSFHGPI